VDASASVDELRPQVAELRLELVGLALETTLDGELVAGVDAGAAVGLGGHPETSAQQFIALSFTWHAA
jgi:hypothetical protein